MYSHKIIIVFLATLTLVSKTWGQSAIPDSIRRKMQMPVRLDSTLKSIKIDSSKTETNTAYDWSKHSPKKAAYRSLMVPGWGQSYNKQHWKIPFVYGGLAGVVIGFRWNNIRYQDFVEAYKASYIESTGTFKPNYDVYVRSQGIVRNLTIDQITKAKDQYRRWRDLNVLVFLGVWALNAVEANVSGHLLTFDDSDDLSIKIKPTIDFSPNVGVAYGAKVTINLHK